MKRASFQTLALAAALSLAAIAGEYAGEVPGQGCDWRIRVGFVR